jgi:16S rRNA (uracil1498-N3)-methyltransferase
MESGDRCELTGENRQYLVSVLRKKKGDKLLLFDGAGCEYEASVIGHDHERVRLEIISKQVIHAKTLNITLSQSLPKAKKMDFIIEKSCELGAGRIIPFVSARSVPRLPPEKASLKQVRWQKIAIEAARKCHSSSIPEIGEIIAFEEMLREAGKEAVKIIFWEEEKRRTLKQVLQSEENNDIKDFFLVIGPEGGFAHEEVELAESMGFTSVSLGRQVLKVETAALAILSIIQYERCVFDLTKV